MVPAASVYVVYREWNRWLATITWPLWWRQIDRISVCVCSFSVCMLFTGSAIVCKARSRDHSSDGRWASSVSASGQSSNITRCGNCLMVPEVSVCLVCRQCNRLLETIMWRLRRLQMAQSMRQSLVSPLMFHDVANCLVAKCLMVQQCKTKKSSLRPTTTTITSV